MQRIPAKGFWKAASMQGTHSMMHIYIARKTDIYKDAKTIAKLKLGNMWREMRKTKIICINALIYYVKNAKIADIKIIWYHK